MHKLLPVEMQPNPAHQPEPTTFMVTDSGNSIMLLEGFSSHGIRNIVRVDVKMDRAK